LTAPTGDWSDSDIRKHGSSGAELDMAPEVAGIERPAMGLA
jgi:hypothetical protein